MMHRPPPDALSLKETKPHLGGGKITGDKLTSTYDLVEQMQYLYVRVVKARDLPAKDVTGSCDPYAEVRLGNYKGITSHVEKKSNPKWNQLFAFSKDRIQSTIIEVTVKDKDFVKDDFMGWVLFDLTEVPKRVPPDSSLAPNWYTLEDRKGIKLKGEIMLAVWWGTQADEAFHEAWHSDAVTVDGIDVVSSKQYLYVCVVKARYLLAEDATGGCDRYVEVRLGNYKETTRHLTLSKKNPNPEWNQVFAFLRDKIEATMLEVTVKDKDVMKDDFVGWVLCDLCDIPKRVQPDSPLAPRWYRLADRKGDDLKGELMFALWWGTQADEAFPEAKSGGVVDPHSSIRSKVYKSPRLWYLRVHVIEGQDLIPGDRTRSPESFVKVTLGNQSMKTRISMAKSKNPLWNEELMFVAAEPFEEHLILSVVDRVAPNKDEVLGSCVIPLQYVEPRVDHRTIRSRWLNLQRDVIVEGQKMKQARFSSRIHLRICFEGGYHVLHEPVHYSSDFRPTARQLWKKSVGILELGILSAHGLSPMKIKDGRATTDAYCVAKYGTKWIRTRTIDNCSPKWNEQYTWEVFDRCTVLTIGVFDNNFHLQGGDKRIGKVRIYLSTLQIDRVYTYSYPLLVLHPPGVKKMGEIHLAVRFI
ncbi:hypothetical protein L1987_41189 [Smallanthus sonchifolius]|uniref:Uncharacterized protein n=1 Tax=Smallanthus sonchifolius TaxID=185202 RepID=A0ACB9GVH3_9ASTR|nr:hypothetical protein L1987_41189 [Smallanthus sonchifolius]